LRRTLAAINARSHGELCRFHLHLTAKRNIAMPQSIHDRAAELHNLAAHAHSAAAASHGQGSPTAHELSRQAHEYSRLAFEESRKAAEAQVESPAPPAARSRDFI
jgi:hypothetical protein